LSLSVLHPLLQFADAAILFGLETKRVGMRRVIWHCLDLGKDVERLCAMVEDPVDSSLDLAEVLEFERSEVDFCACLDDFDYVVLGCAVHGTGFCVGAGGLQLDARNAGAGD